MSFDVNDAKEFLRTSFLVAGNQSGKKRVTDLHVLLAQAISEVEALEARCARYSRLLDETVKVAERYKEALEIIAGDPGSLTTDMSQVVAREALRETD